MVKCMNNLKDIKAICDEFNNNVLLIERKLKSVQSIKCNLKKQKKVDNYDQLMTDILQYEQLLKEAKYSLQPKKKFVTDYSIEDIKVLDFDETRKAIKSIQSKKCLSFQFGQDDEVEKAERIEKLLKDHLETVKPVDESYIRKTDLITIIETIENDITMTNDLILKHLKELIK